MKPSLPILSAIQQDPRLCFFLTNTALLIGKSKVHLLRICVYAALSVAVVSDSQPRLHSRTLTYSVIQPNVAIVCHY